MTTESFPPPTCGVGRGGFFRPGISVQFWEREEWKILLLYTAPLCSLVICLIRGRCRAIAAPQLSTLCFKNLFSSVLWQKFKKISVLAVGGNFKGHCHEKGIKKGVKSTYTCRCRYRWNFFKNIVCYFIFDLKSSLISLFVYDMYVFFLQQWPYCHFLHAYYATRL